MQPFFAFPISNNIMPPYVLNVTVIHIKSFNIWKSTYNHGLFKRIFILTDFCIMKKP